MGRLSQFAETAALQADGTVQVTGKTELAAEGGSDGPAHFHFAIIRNGKVARGDVESADASWGGVTAPVQGLDAGPAHAFGLAVEFRDDPLAYETFAWVQPIKLTGP